MDVLAKARALAHDIAARAGEIETARRLPADLSGRMAEAGVYRTLLPASLGGLECDPGTALKVIETLAAADASAGWCAMIGATAALPAAYMDPAAAGEIFAEPDCVAGGVFAPMGRAEEEGDAYRLSGRWRWASNSVNCTWLSGGAAVLAAGAPRTLPGGVPEQRMMFFPADDAELIDTWHAAGLAGTGSGDMAVHHILVPRDRTVALGVDKPVAPGALYAFPVFGLLALGIAAVALGNAGAALDALVTLAGEKRPAGGRRTLAERGTVQAGLARADAAQGAARAYLYATVEEAWTTARAGDALGRDVRARLRLAATHAARTGADVARTAYDLAGGDAVFLASPLQRRFRDAHVATQHMMVAPPTWELAGRVRLGLEADERFL